MTDFDIISLRLQNQHLSGPDFQNADDVVAHFGAVQAQDFDGAIWSIGLRMNQAKADDIESAFNAGRILRTHVMRPTWHFVMPEDIRWMLKLTRPQVKKRLVTNDRRLEIDEAFLIKCRESIEKALESGKYLTRKELEGSLLGAGVNAHGLRLGHVMAHMELDALVCSGPRRGKETTYALLEERVPVAPIMTREQSLATLASKFFRGHGPAQLKDFEWWSGLSHREGAEAVELIKDGLQSKVEGSQTYYYFHPHERAPQKRAHDFLLSMFDEYIIAYKDRAVLSERGERDAEKVMAMGNAATGATILNGRIAGSWKRILEKGEVELKVSPFRPLGRHEEVSLRTEVDRFGEFWGLKSTFSC